MSKEILVISPSTYKERRDAIINGRVTALKSLVADAINSAFPNVYLGGTSVEEDSQIHAWAKTKGYAVEYDSDEGLHTITPL